MIDDTVQSYFDQIEQINRAFGQQLDQISEDGVIDTDESRQVKGELIAYRAKFQQARDELVQAEADLQAKYRQKQREAQADNAPQRELSRLRLKQYHDLRPYALLQELIDRMLEMMASIPRPSYDAAKDVQTAFRGLAGEFWHEIEQTPTETDTQAVLAVNVLEMQLADHINRWERLLSDVSSRYQRADESPLQRVYLKGIQAALTYVLRDVRQNEGDPTPLQSYDGLLDLDYKADVD